MTIPLSKRTPLFDLVYSGTHDNQPFHLFRAFLTSLPRFYKKLLLAGLYTFWSGLSDRLLENSNIFDTIKELERIIRTNEPLIIYELNDTNFNLIEDFY